MAVRAQEAKGGGAFDILGDAGKKKKFDAGEIDADGRETMRGFGGGQDPRSEVARG